MDIGHIEGATVTLGQPKDWDESKGKCYGLPVLVGESEIGRVMISAWFPTPDELAQLIAGESIKLWIYGNTHPVVSLTVGEVK